MSEKEPEFGNGLGCWWVLIVGIICKTAAEMLTEYLKYKQH